WDRYGWHNSYVPEGCAAIVEFVATSATVANRERFALALNAPAAAPVITQPAIPRPRAQRNAPRSPPRPPPPARPDSIWASGPCPQAGRARLHKNHAPARCG